MFSRFFIDRPIFAAVLSVFIVLAGPRRDARRCRSPSIPRSRRRWSPCGRSIPGASAEVLEQTVAAPIENADQRRRAHDLHELDLDRRNGVVQIQVTFDIGTNVDKAALNVNNRVKQAEPRLPQEVRRQGVTVEKGSSAFLQVLAFYSPDGRYDDVFISNYVTLNVLDQLKRVPGTTNVQIFGAKDYAMRIWLQPDRLTQLRLTPADLIRAVNEQNAQFAAGKVGQSPDRKRQELVYTITTQRPARRSRRSSRRSSCARIPTARRCGCATSRGWSSAGKDYDFIGRINGRAATLVGVFLQPGANALEVGGRR